MDRVKEQIKQAADIVDLIGQVVQLKKVGRNYVGLCPFHSEKAPSFTVAPDRQIFHCFGCKKGGDVLSFWMEYHGLSFPEAVKELAHMYQIPLESDVRRPAAAADKGPNKEQLLEVNELAASFFQGVLRHPVKGEAAREYLAMRALPEKVTAEFRVGYAPPDWHALQRFLEKRGVGTEVGVAAGVLVRNEKGNVYDRFRGRLIFPITGLSPRRAVIGFGGRVLDQGLPKYINTPETAVFHKGDFLYGLHAAQEVIRKSGSVILVEGYMDCLALRARGFENVVATLGTALSVRALRRLRGLASEAVVVFDGDEAGMQFAVRSLPLFVNEDFPVRAVVLPEGEDPDSFVRERGAEDFSGMLEASVPLFDLMLEWKLGSASEDPGGRARIVKEVFPLLAEVSGEIHRNAYLGRLCQRVGLSEEMVRTAFARYLRDHGPGPAVDLLGSRLEGVKRAKRFGRDLHLLNLLVHFPDQAVRLADCPWENLLEDPLTVELVRRGFSLAAEAPLTPERFLEGVDSEEARQRITEAVVLGPFFLEEDVDRAVSEMRDRARALEISGSARKAAEREDLEALNEILKRKARQDRTLE